MHMQINFCYYLQTNLTLANWKQMETAMVRIAVPPSLSPLIPWQLIQEEEQAVKKELATRDGTMVGRGVKHQRYEGNISRGKVVVNNNRGCH